MSGLPISAPQQRKIHVLARELGMDNDLLHEYVNMLTGQDSLRDLSIREAAVVIDELEKNARQWNGEEDRARPSSRQLHYIQGLLAQLGWTDEAGNPDKKRLDGFVRRQCGIDDSRWMDRRAASKVIEGLKSLASRQPAGEGRGSPEGSPGRGKEGGAGHGKGNFKIGGPAGTAPEVRADHRHRKPAAAGR